MSNHREPTSPIDIQGGAANARVSSSEVMQLSPEFLNNMNALCPVATDLETTTEASRDWWPHDMHLAL